MERDACVLAARDGYVLDKIRRDWRSAPEEWLAVLERKLAAARLPAGSATPPGLAVIDARVSFRCARGWNETRTLCLPRGYAPGSAFLPVTSLYGLALVGLGEGRSIAFERHGRRDWILLEKVWFQPAPALSTPAENAPPARRAFRLIRGGLAQG